MKAANGGVTLYSQRRVLSNVFSVLCSQCCVLPSSSYEPGFSRYLTHQTSPKAHKRRKHLETTPFYPRTSWVQWHKRMEKAVFYCVYYVYTFVLKDVVQEWRRPFSTD